MSLMVHFIGRNHLHLLLYFGYWYFQMKVTKRLAVSVAFRGETLLLVFFSWSGEPNGFQYDLATVMLDYSNLLCR